MTFSKLAYPLLFLGFFSNACQDDTPAAGAYKGGAGSQVSQNAENKNPQSPAQTPAGPANSANPGVSPAVGQAPAGQQPQMTGGEMPAMQQPMQAPTTETKTPPKVGMLFVSAGNGKIDVYKFDREAGTATLLKSNQTKDSNPSFLAFDTKRKLVFASNERDDGGMKSYGFDPATGTLNFLSDAKITGGATHISVDPSGKFAFGASYGSGHIASFVIGADGKFAATAATDVVAGVRAHAIIPFAPNSSILAPCLGSNYLAQYTLDKNTGALSAPLTLAIEGGPRHIAAHANQKWVYVINEGSMKMQALTYANGKLSLNGAPVLALEKAEGGTAAEIQIHPNGKFVYSSNRGPDSIAQFAIQEDGSVKFLKTVKSGGQTPRHFSLDSTGKWAFVANQGSGGNVAFFSVDPATGAMTASDKAKTIPAPSVGFVELVDFE